MGNTSIIEINHDQCHEINDNPLKFAEQIKEQMSFYKHSGRRILGGKVIAGFHRSGKINNMWCDFKKKFQSLIVNDICKLNTVNVIEMAHGNLLSIRSFLENEEGNKKAEKLFDDILKEHGVIDCGYRHDYIDDGHYQDTNGHEIFLTHSI